MPSVLQKQRGSVGLKGLPDHSAAFIATGSAQAFDWGTCACGETGKL